MQLTTIALATIFITFFITSSVRCTTSEKLMPRRSSTGSIKEYTEELNRQAKEEEVQRAKIEKERQARKEKAQESLKLKEGGLSPTGLKEPTPRKPTPASEPRPSVRTFPPSAKSGKEPVESTPTRKPTATSSPLKPTPSSTAPPAFTSTKPIPLKPVAESGFGLPRSGEKPHVSKVAGLRKHWEPASTSESTSAPKPSVKTPSLSSTKTTRTRTMPTGPAKGPTATPHTEPTPSSKASPAPKFTKPAASPQPVTASSGSAQTLLPPPGTPSGPPQFYREQGSGVAGSASQFEPTPLPSQLPSHPSSKSPAASKMSGVTKDTDLMNFKEKIEKGAYSEAMEIVVSLSGEKSCEPYGKYLAGLTVKEIIKMVNGFEEAFLTEPLPEGEHEYILKSPYSKPTLGLFLMHANDKKLTLLLPRFGPRDRLGALMSSIKYGAGSSLGNFIKVFREISIIDKNELSFALEAAAECIFGYYEPEFFNELVIKLRDQKILDKDLVNVALNAAFVEACRQENFSALDYYDLKDVDFPSWVYAKAMRLSYDKTRDRNDIFTWLVGCADGDDLHIFLRENNGENRYVGEKLKMIEDLYLMRRYEPKKPRTKSSSSSYSYLFDKQQE